MPQVEVLFSSINVAKSPNALRSAAWLGEFAAGAGCDGVEYMPIFDMLPGHTPAAIGRAVSRGALELRSLHTSFRVGQNSLEANKKQNPSEKGSLTERVINSRLGRIIMPEMIASAGVMADIQTHANAKLPVVLYPQKDPSLDKLQIKAAQAKQHLFQPTNHVGEQVGARSLEEFDQIMRGQRDYEYVLDLYHARRKYGKEQDGIISNTSDSVSYMAPNSPAIHLSLGRADISGEPHIPTRQEAQDALRGVYRGELGEMLTTLKDSGRVEYAVIEMTSDAVVAASGYSKLPDIQKSYADIANGFREYWS